MPAFSSRFRSVARSIVSEARRATEVEAIVQADLDGLIVGAEAAERSERNRSGEAARAEVVVHVLDLGRPILGEHVFETGTDGVAVAVVAVEAERDRSAGETQRFVVVRISIAALHVEQGRTPSVADAAGDGTEAALVVRVN